MTLISFVYYFSEVSKRKKRFQKGMITDNASSRNLHADPLDALIASLMYQDQYVIKAKIYIEGKIIEGFIKSVGERKDDFIVLQRYVIKYTQSLEQENHLNDDNYEKMFYYIKKSEIKDMQLEVKDNHL
jgi:hypothetical protein